MPLLTADEEIVLGKAIQGKRVSKKRKQDARVKLVLHNTRLVVSIAFDICKRAKNNAEKEISLIDMISEGIFGLLDAADRFNPEFGCRFSTYATYWIRRHILRGLNGDRMIRVPHYMHAIVAKMSWAYSQLSTELDRVPNDVEMSELLNCTLGEYQRTVEIIGSTKVFLPTADSSDPDQAYFDTAEEGSEDSVERDAIREEEKDTVWRVLCRMENKHAFLIMLRRGIGLDELRKENPGLDSKRRFPLNEIGDMLGISREKTRLLEQEAMEIFEQFYIEERGRE
jgi:RNA polymerase primary sigma factor